jgi:hypothetical protein
MAQGNKEHRMLFDIRGRRRHVVKVVYAILAILMAASLFLVTGALNIGSILGTNSGGSSATKSFEEQAERIETKLAKSPEDETLLLNLTRTRINAGHSMVSSGSLESQNGLEEVKHQYALATEAWSKYLEAAPKPSPGLATQVSTLFYELASISTTGPELVENMASAAEAEEIVVAVHPTLNSWSSLATYRLYSGDFAGAKEAKEEAVKLTETKFEREGFENEFVETEKNAREIKKQAQAEEAVASGNKSAGKESIENPLNPLGGGNSLGE